MGFPCLWFPCAPRVDPLPRRTIPWGDPAGCGAIQGRWPFDNSLHFTTQTGPRGGDSAPAAGRPPPDPPPPTAEPTDMLVEAGFGSMELFSVIEGLEDRFGELDFTPARGLLWSQG